MIEILRGEMDPEHSLDKTMHAAQMASMALFAYARAFIPGIVAQHGDETALNAWMNGPAAHFSRMFASLSTEDRALLASFPDDDLRKLKPYLTARSPVAQLPPELSAVGDKCLSLFRSTLLAPPEHRRAA